jgi:hypothetical protein
MTATARWSALASQSADISSSGLNSLADGSVMAPVTINNATNRYLYAVFELFLNTISTSSGSNVTLVVQVGGNAGANAPDNGISAGGGERYNFVLAASNTTHRAVFPMVRLYPTTCSIYVINNTGTAFNAASNTLKYEGYNEELV